MKPEAIIVGGPNGAGKTTFAQEFLRRYEPAYEYISADQIAAELTSGPPDAVRLQAGRRFFERIEAAMDRGTSVVIESTLSQPSPL